MPGMAVERQVKVVRCNIAEGDGDSVENCRATWPLTGCDTARGARLSLASAGEAQPAQIVDTFHQARPP
jgi:hypothetical protein